MVIVFRKHNDASADINEDDPEFFTLELSPVERHLLRDIQAIIRPDPLVENENCKPRRGDGAIKWCFNLVSSGDNSPKEKPRRRL